MRKGLAKLAVIGLLSLTLTTGLYAQEDETRAGGTSTSVIGDDDAFDDWGLLGLAGLLGLLGLLPRRRNDHVHKPGSVHATTRT